MGLLGRINRLAGKLDRKIEGTAVVLGAENAPTTAAPAAVTELQKEEAEEVEGEEA
jgi:hypothetical protein